MCDDAPRRVVLGGPADLVVLRARLREILEAPSAEAVAQTIIGGIPIGPEWGPRASGELAS